jgi:flagellar basal-body rod protein FlgF
MGILRDNKSVTAQNLANTSSTGFQKDISVNFSSVYLDRDKGIDPRVFALQDTGGFDSSIDGNGYFIVLPANGSPAMSKRGDFTVSANGFLTDGTGTRALNVDLEPIEVPNYRKISVSGDGIVEIEPLVGPVGQKVKVGQIATVSGSEEPLAKSLDGYVRTAKGGIAEPDNKTFILSGFLEGSNVKSVDELVAGIDQSRAYEINVKFISTAKEIDEATASLMRMPN